MCIHEYSSTGIDTLHYNHGYTVCTPLCCRCIVDVYRFPFCAYDFDDHFPLVNKIHVGKGRQDKNLQILCSQELYIIIIIHEQL